MKIVKAQQIEIGMIDIRTKGNISSWKSSENITNQNIVVDSIVAFIIVDDIFIVFVLIVVAGGYAIVTLKNINGLIKVASATLQRNLDHLNQIIPNINEISENTVKSRMYAGLKALKKNLIRHSQKKEIYYE